MGHERVGFLPRTKRWRDIVNRISEASTVGEFATADIAAKTLHNVSNRYLHLHCDRGIQAAFGYLIGLAICNLPAKDHSLASPSETLEGNPSPARIVKHLNDWVRANANSLEYAELASRAAADAIAEWTREQTSQTSLFEEYHDARNVWNKAANGREFCRVARSFFGHFTERYMLYFLEREASSVISSLTEREQFSKNIKNHIESVAKHAFETSKITQSFSAGWFNKYACTRRPSDSDIKNFLAIAFNKLHEELQREET